MKKRLAAAYLATMLLTLAIPFASSEPDTLESITAISGGRMVDTTPFIANYSLQSISDSVPMQMLAVGIGITLAYLLGTIVVLGVVKLRLRQRSTKMKT